MALTDQNGKYSIPVWFDTYTGTSLLGDECDATLKNVSLAAYTRTDYSLPTIVPVGRPGKIAAPPVKIEQPIVHDSVW